MSGIAELLINLGFEVTGSDMKTTNITENLQKHGATIHEGHKPENVNDSDVLVYSCLLYTSPSPRDGLLSRMPSSA